MKPSVADPEHHIDPTDFAQAEITKSLSPETKIRLPPDTIRIRRFEATHGNE